MASSRVPLVQALREFLGKCSAAVGIMIDGRGIVRSKTGGRPPAGTGRYPKTRGRGEISFAPDVMKLRFCARSDPDAMKLTAFL